MNSENKYIDLEDSFSFNKPYYFVAQNGEKKYNNSNFTLSVYSTDTFVNIDNFIQAKMKIESSKIYIYKFHIPLEHKKYLLYDFDTGKVANITVVDNKEKNVYQNNSIYGQNYLELKDGYSYNIYLSLSEVKQDFNGLIYFYFIQSKYTKVFSCCNEYRIFSTSICTW